MKDTTAVLLNLILSSVFFSHTCQVVRAKMREISGLSPGVSTLGGDGCQILEQKSGSLLRKEADLASMSLVVVKYDLFEIEYFLFPTLVK